MTRRVLPIEECLRLINQGIDPVKYDLIKTGCMSIIKRYVWDSKMKRYEDSNGEIRNED